MGTERWGAAVVGALWLLPLACGGSTNADRNQSGATGGGETGGADAATGGDDSGGTNTGGTPGGGGASGSGGSGGGATGGSAVGGGATGGTPESGGNAAGGTATGGTPESGGNATGGLPPGGAPAGGAGASTPVGGSPPGGAPAGGTGAAGGSPALGGSAGAGGSATITEAELADCSWDEDCTIVTYDHCCGSTRRAINAAHVATYEAHPEWQVFDDPATCAVIGACPDDSAVVAAWCYRAGAAQGTCQLVWPNLCPVFDCQLDCPHGYWQSADNGCGTCACAPPPLILDPSGTGGIAFVTLSTVVDHYIGAIDRTWFTFTWRYDDPRAEDDEYTVTVHLAFAHLDGSYFGTETTYPVGSSAAIESVTIEGMAAGQGSYYYETSAGYLSVRGLGDALEGGIYLEGVSDIGNPGSVIVGGTFRVPNPW